MQAPADKEIKVDWSVCFTQIFLRALLNFLNIAAWVLLLAGVAYCQDECNSNTWPTPFPGFAAVVGNDLGLKSASNTDCVKFFGLTWWAVWLQFITVVVATAFTFQYFSQSTQLKAIFTTTMYFFIMSTVLLFFIAEMFSNATYLVVEKDLAVSSAWEAGTTLVTVGSIMSLVFNFMWIIWNSYADVPSFPGATTTAPPVIDQDGAPMKGDEPTVTATTA